VPLSVPVTFGDITVSWLDAALKEGGLVGADVATVVVEPMDPSKGLIGDLAEMQVTYDRGQGPARLVIKLPAASPDSRSIGEMLNAYGREVAFYRHVAPHSSGTQLPQCFYAGEEVDARRWAIILEAIDGDEFDFLAGASPSQATAAVDALADFHAVWWQSETVFDWMPGFDVGGVGRLQPLWLDNLPTFVERYRDALPGATADWVSAFAPQLSDWSTAAAQQPLTMVHSDYRLDNMLFHDGTVTVIDWQTTMRAPAAMDLSCFISTSLSIEDRRRDESALIDRYIARLEQGGVAIDPQWLHQSYDENLLWWMGQFGNNLAHLRPGDGQVQQALTTMANRVYTTALDRNVGRLL